MSERRDTDASAENLRAALREALAVRDRRAGTPPFDALARRGPPVSRHYEWRPALAMAASTLIVVAGVLLWTGTRKPETPMLDARLVDELSPASYWRVPSDELLAYAPEPFSLEIAVDTGLPVSLEESLL